MYALSAILSIRVNKKYLIPQAEWINFAKNTEISVIFADPVHCKKLSQTLSNELNLKIIYLSSPMEAVSNDDVTYFSEMRKYSNIIINALM